MKQQATRPDYIFEVSWEVCNKVGGIHTVITSKTLTLINEWEDHLIMIGPDTWKGNEQNPEFLEDENLFPSWKSHAVSMGLKIKIGRWKITGNPIVILVDFTPFFTKKDEIFKNLWLQYKVDSLTGGWDYIEPALFGYAAGRVIECFYHHHLTFSDKIIAISFSPDERYVAFASRQHIAIARINGLDQFFDPNFRLEWKLGDACVRLE